MTPDLINVVHVLIIAVLASIGLCSGIYWTLPKATKI